MNGKEVRGYRTVGRLQQMWKDNVWLSPPTQLSHFLNPTYTAANLTLLRIQPKTLILFANEFLPI